ncbi:MAG: tetratricopeptide repeat protein [Deltaproteobacteria bacterium]|jgi:hypothetical protein|nr:tetratricopeptide repeat protein [Deltaproteobacteria bacterium]
MQIFDNRRKAVLEMLTGIAADFRAAPVLLAVPFFGFSRPENGTGGEIDAWAGRAAGKLEGAGEELAREAAEWAAAAAGTGPLPDISDVGLGCGKARHGLDFMLLRLLEARRRFSEAGSEVPSGLSDTPDEASPAAIGLMGALAECLRALKDLQRAVSFHAMAGAARAQALGASHHSVAESLTGLADSLREAGESEISLQVFDEAYVIRKKAFGEGDPRTLASIHDLAAAFLQKDDVRRGHDLLRQAVSGRRKRLGPGHPDTAESVVLLAVCHIKNKKLGQARSVMERGFSDARQALGPVHPVVVKSAAVLASILMLLGESVEAVNVKHALLNDRRERLRPGGLLTPLAAALSELCAEDEFRALSGGDQAARARLLGDSPQAAFAGVFREAAFAVETGLFDRAGRLFVELTEINAAAGRLYFSESLDTVFTYCDAMSAVGATLPASIAYREAREASSKASGFAFPDSVFFNLGLATMHLVGGEPPDADLFSGYAWQELKKRGKPRRADPARELEALERLAAIRLALGDLAGHAEVLERHVSLTVKALGRGHRRSWRPSIALSLLHALNGDAAKALKYRELCRAAILNMLIGIGKET